MLVNVKPARTADICKSVEYWNQEFRVTHFGRNSDSNSRFKKKFGLRLQTLNPDFDSGIQKNHTPTLTPDAKLDSDSILRGFDGGGLVRAEPLPPQIQFMKQLQKPIAIHLVTVKDLTKHNIT